MNFRTISKHIYKYALVLLLGGVVLCPVDKSYAESALPSSCDIIFEKTIEPVKVKAMKAKDKVVDSTKSFYNNFKKSWGLNIFFKLATEQSAYVKQIYAGFLSQRKEAKKIKWEKGKRSKWLLDKVTNSLFYYMELPLHGTKYIVTKTSLKQLDDLIDNQNKKYISISYSVPKDGITPEELEAVKQIFLKLKSDHGDDVVVIHSFLNDEFIEKLNIPTDFMDMFKEVFPNRESYFTDLKSLSDSRQKMGERLEEVGGTSYFIGDLKPVGVAEEISTYSSKNFVMNHLELTPFKGPVQKLTSHPRFFTALNYLSEKLNNENLEKDKWEFGVELTTIGNISLILAIMHLPLTKYVWEKYEAVDPFTQTVEISGREAHKFQQNITLRNEEITLNFFIENDPRFRDLKVGVLKEKINQDEALALAKERVDQIRSIIAQGLDPQKPETPEGYTRLAEFFEEFLTKIKIEKDQDLSSSEDLYSEADNFSSLSPVEMETLQRLALFDHPMFKDIGILTVSPELVGSVDELPWIRIYKRMGFNVSDRNFDYIDLTSAEGLKILDDRIINKIESFITINHVFKYLSNGKILEELPQHLKDRVQLRINTPEFKSLELLYKNDQITAEERNSKIIKWLAAVQFEELHDFLGVYKD